MYGYGDLNGGPVALFTMRSRPDGGFDGTVKSWNVPAGNWDWNRVQLTSGDYNGDHRADVAAMYDYGGGSAGVFTQDLKSWQTPANTWWGDAARPLSGDVDGNGREDIVAMYDSSDGSSGFHTFLAQADGRFDTALDGWQATPGTW